MDLSLTLGDERLDPEGLHELALELRRSIETHTDARATLVTGTARLGSKGEPVTMGALALALITSGAVGSLVRVLGSYVSRRPTLQFELRRPDGATLTLTAEHLHEAQLDRTLGALEQFVGEGP